MRRNTKSRFFSFILSLLIFSTSLPLNVFAQEQSNNLNQDTNKKEETTVTDSDINDISVKWTFEEEEITSEKQGKVNISASLNKDNNKGINAASVEIILTKDEAIALNILSQDGISINEDAFKDNSNIDNITNSDSNVKITPKIEEDDVHLVFGLDKENPNLSYDYTFYASKNITLPFIIDVSEDDIIINAMSADNNNIEDININKETNKLNIIEDNSIEENKKETESETTNKSLDEPELIQSDEDKVDIDSYDDGYFVNIFWVDNNNESDKRPGTTNYPMPELSFSIDNGSYEKLTEDNMSTVGLATYPDITIEQSGVGTYSLYIGEEVLPSKITYTDIYGVSSTHDIKWKITPCKYEGYELIEVTEDNKDQYPSINETGWYYILLSDLSFTAKFRIGDEDAFEEIQDAMLNNFELVVDIENQNQQKIPLNELVDELEFKENTSSNSVVITIKDTWRYNIDGSKIMFSIEEYEPTSNEPNKIFVNGVFDDGDYLAVSYDNSSSANHGTITDKLYSNGTLYLTLTGTKNYEAYKVWVDDGSIDTKNKRPGGEFQLWRYRSGDSYITASPIRNSDGSIVSVDINTNINNQTIMFFVNGELDLPKYDTEGYEYYYVAREYLDSDSGENNYTQVFGDINQDGTINDRLDVNGEIQNIDDERNTNNTFIYSGGTISNRITDTVSTEVTKIWNASSFQADFEDVSVEIKLQSRLAGSNNEWNDTGDKILLDNFYAENLTQSENKSMPKYDYLGRELEYRWVECGVYKGDSENLFIADENGGGTFTLKQDGRDIHYKSSCEMTSENNVNKTILRNYISNNINYYVNKTWHDSQGNVVDGPANTNVKFNVYRVTSEETLGGDSIASFYMDGVVDEDKTLVNKDLGIYIQETSPWKVTISPLAEFNEDGSDYEYAVIEQAGNYSASYDTYRDDNRNYITNIVNAPGTGNAILVSKNWVDDTDLIHRLPVTITVYNRYTNEKVNEITFDKEVWYDFVGIGSLKPEDVYILETKVGDYDVPLTYYELDSGQAPNYTFPSAPNEYDGISDTSYTSIQYETNYHEYDVKYSSSEFDGVKLYTAINRRLGSVNITANKKWIDGDGSRREQIQKELNNIKEKDGTELSLALKLVFAEGTQKEYYSISNKGVENADTIIVGNSDNMVPIKDKDGKNVSSIQKILWSDGDREECLFYNLPKYDREGHIVSYDLQEVWVDSDGNIISKQEISNKYPDLYNLIKDYNMSISETKYEVGDLFASDEQIFDVTNKLSGTKTITWNKEWKDEYMYTTGQRPDIYLDVYQTIHSYDENNNVKKSNVAYIIDYKWSYEDLEGSDIRHNWKVELLNVPKYDSLGYEIEYYAVERSLVNAFDFDYQYVQYSIPDNNSLTNIGNRNEILPGYDDYVLDTNEIEGKPNIDDYPKYALIEGGTFTNTIKSDIVIQGQKIWDSVSNTYPNVDLPSVTFTLYKSLADGDMSDRIAVATITVDDWASVYKNGSYLFQLIYEGKNVLEKNDDGTVSTVYGGSGEGVKLPKYNEHGKLYSYELKETSINWPNGASVDEDKVFEDPVENTYLIENIYKSEKGELSVKKFLELSFDDSGKPKAFPAIRFKLSRTYTKNDGTTSQPEFVGYKNWGSSEVEDAYNLASILHSNAGSSENPLEKELTFEDLDVYAPNGSEYVYTVEEEKTYLGGYDTWAVSGNLEKENVADSKVQENEKTSVSGLKPSVNSSILGSLFSNTEPSATFINAYNGDREVVHLSGKKIWKDYNNTFGIRPEDITIKLYRYANEQPSQGNAIAESEVPQNDYTLTWMSKDSTSDWEYYITGTIDNELERYSPNGMQWQYVVKEILPDGSVYRVTPSEFNNIGRVDEKSQSGSEVEMHDLTNYIASNISYSKTWVDQNGEIVENDYLGFDVTVDFKLQVAEIDENGKLLTNYKDASSYFKEKLSSEDYNKIFNGLDDSYFTPSLTGRLNDKSVWGVNKYFYNLPNYIVKESSSNNITTKLTYRVVETSIKYDGHEININVKEGDNNTYTYEFTNGGMFTPAYWANGRGTLTEGQTYNDTSTSYNENNTRNLYNRLETTSFDFTKVWENDANNAYGTRVKTTKSGYNWQTSFIVQRKTDSTQWSNVEIYANNGTSKDYIVTIYGKNSENSITSSISGLPKYDNEGNEYKYRVRELDSDYVITNGHVDNKYIIGSGDDYTYNYTYTTSYDSNTVVKNTLNSTKIYALKKWNPSSSKANVTLELKYQKENGTWASFSPAARVTLDGKADSQKTYYEYEDWKAVWNNVPEVVKGSKLDDNNKTIYKVFETLSNGYIQESASQGKLNNYDLFEFTNVQSVSYSVEKVWYGVNVADRGVVSVGLWRTTGEIGDENSEKVIKSGTDEQYILNLTSNKWSGTFTNLPKYNQEGEEYTYYAREISVGGVNIEDCNYKIINNDTNNKTTITNIGLMNVSGTKTWKDNNNSYNTRPENITLTLYRSVNNLEKEEVNIVPEWISKEGNTWTYSFNNLPVTDENGNIYSYEVVEDPVNEYKVIYDGYNITNTLSDNIEIPIVKIWDDGDDITNSRPDEITIALYSNGKYVKEVQVSGKENEWNYVFEDLPEYDENNVRIIYTIKEVDIPEGYEVSYYGFKITNHKDIPINDENKNTDKTNGNNKDGIGIDTSDENNINIHILTLISSIFALFGCFVVLKKRYQK